MPIPSFDLHGNLPVGNLFAEGHSLVHATLQEIHDRFVAQVQDSARRSLVWDGWMRHRNEVESVGIRYATLLDGSFVTAKREPEDVDLCILYDAEEANQLGPTERSQLLGLLRGPACKADYLCDAYGLGMYPFSNLRFPLTVEGFAYWTRVFGIDRQDRQKSFLLVNERGTL